MLGQIRLLSDGHALLGIQVGGVFKYDPKIFPGEERADVCAGVLNDVSNFLKISLEPHTRCRFVKPLHLPRNNVGGIIWRGGVRVP
jgi:hypothetical protein